MPGRCSMTVPPNAPLRLTRAAELAFPDGGMTAAGLRREAARGRLTIERIAGKDFTTLAAIEEMRERCRRAKGPRLWLKPAYRAKNPSGSSAMEESATAQAAALAIARKLKNSSPTTSPKNTGRAKSAAVIRPKFSSLTS